MSFGLLEGAALIASPGPRRGRYLVHWGHGVVLLQLAAAVQVSTLAYEAASPDQAFPWRTSLDWRFPLLLPIALSPRCCPGYVRPGP
jgi:hypothetical protein